MIIYIFYFLKNFGKKEYVSSIYVLSTIFYIYFMVDNFYSNQDNLLSDEEAKEIKKLLSPSDNDQLNTSDWMSEVLSEESSDNIKNQRYLKINYFIYLSFI